MRTDRRLARWLTLLTMTVTCGCAASQAPHGWLPYAQEAQAEGYGGWIEVEPRDVMQHEPLRGELLAISDDSVLVLAAQGVRACALADVRQARLEAFDNRSGDTARMTLAGTLTSVSTGLGLIVVAPLWIVVGSISTAVLSHQGTVMVRAPRVAAIADSIAAGGRTITGHYSWRDLRLFARFPQGLPAGLERTQLRQRPLIKRKHKTGIRPGTIVSE